LLVRHNDARLNEAWSDRKSSSARALDHDARPQNVEIFYTLIPGSHAISYKSIIYIHWLENCSRLETTMFRKKRPMNARTLVGRTVVAILGGAAVAAASAAPSYFNGFETNTVDWSQATRVASGTGGITSAAGGYHATTTTYTPSTGTTNYTQWGGYNFGAGNAVPTAFQPYSTSIDIYLDVDANWNNDTRFDFSSAINKSDGTFQRDFIFNAGFYNDASGPGANTKRFVISASNNSQRANAYAKNPGRDPIAISTTGWYTFEQSFYDNAGVLAVDLEIFDATSALVHKWTLSDTSDLISGMGGNRYGWFDVNEFSSLAIDNAMLEVGASVPEPATLLLVGASLLGLVAVRRKSS
jgi:hypothetical protein